MRLASSIFVMLLFTPQLMAQDFKSHYSIDPVSDFDGPTHTQVREILDPVYNLLVQSFDSNPRYPVEVYFRSQGPKVDLVSGVHRVGISAQQTFWMRYAYEFSHEIGHVLTNWQDLEEYRFSWFNETMCELASLYVISSFAESGLYGFSYEQWMNYLNDIKVRYTSDRWTNYRIGEDSRTGSWFPRFQSEMERNNLIRELNAAIAFELLPYFVDRPELWQGVAYINQWDTSRNRDFREYLSSWTTLLQNNGHDVDAVALVGTVIYSR